MGDPTGGGGLEAFAADAGVDESPQVLDWHAGLVEGFFGGPGGSFGQGLAFFPPAAFANAGEGLQLSGRDAEAFESGCDPCLQLIAGDNDRSQFTGEGIEADALVAHELSGPPCQLGEMPG